MTGSSAPERLPSRARADVEPQPVLARLSRLDRWLPAWILAAMLLGLALGRLVPGLAVSLARYGWERFRCPSRSGCW